MPHDAEELIATRVTLLNRIKDWRDHDSWQEFFDIYWKLIYGIARKAGLTETEAQDVVQETLASVARHMPEFKYDPANGTFKAWLLKMTRWRIVDHFRQRLPAAAPVGDFDETAQTPLIEKVVDASTLDLKAAWETDWAKNLLDAAMTTVKLRIDPEKFQIFDFYVNQGWPPEKTARTFNVSVNQVYLVKSRVTEMLKEEIRRLEKEIT